MNTTPANGERAAATGLRGQYLVAATVILRQLHQLEAIRLADPYAGRVDDFQILVPSRIDAYQIKWSQYDGPFTFRDLVRPARGKPSLIAQLTDGWLRLGSASTDRRVVVHLVTNDIPSSSDKLPCGQPPPTPGHFAAFLEQVWRPMVTRPAASAIRIPDAWKPAWDALQGASGLAPDRFAEFVRDCQLEYGAQQPLMEPRWRDQEVNQRDVRHVADTLFSVVADAARVIQLGRKALLQRLGWEDRFEYRSRHEFPEPSIPYRPIEETVEQVRKAVASLSRGYLLLEGSPGSGKSTLLTLTLRELPVRVIRYYAYVPDDPTPRRIRGETTSFLHDVGIALNEAGFLAGVGLKPSDRELLLERFHRQLGLLHEDWREHGRKTVILIDGLDHIAREQHPQQSLLHDLPDPDQIPEGVLVLLGSQTDGPLPPRIQHAVREPGRRLVTQCLSRAATLEILAAAELPQPLAGPQADRACELTGGHPLALAYVVNQLREAADEESITAVLDRAHRFGADIEEQYQAYWNQIATSRTMRELLGLLARVRGHIDLHWVEAWADRDALDALVRTASHYFRQEGQRWFFFHNSFREYLRAETRRSPSGTADDEAELDRQLHIVLANHCATASPESPWSWNELYHRFEARDYQGVVRLATPKYWRRQFMAFRPIDAIRTDIDLALLANAEVQDVVALARIVLAGAEFEQRARCLSDTDLPSLFLRLGMPDAAAAHVRDGNHLLVDARNAFDYCRELISQGAVEEARRVFELAEPLSLLTGAISVPSFPHRPDLDTLCAWGALATFFFPVSRVIEAVNRVRGEGDPHRQLDIHEATQYVHREVRGHVGIALMEREDWGGLDALLRTFDIRQKHDLRSWSWICMRACLNRAAAGDIELARSFAQRVIDVVRPSSLPTDARLVVAECAYRILRNARLARDWLADSPQPDLAKTAVSPEAGLSPFMTRFRLNRLRFALGREEAIESIVPDAERVDDQPLVLFERAVCKIARIWAWAWRGRPVTAYEVRSESRPILEFLNLDDPELKASHHWYMLRQLRKELFCLLIQAVSRHGATALTTLRTTMQEQWKSAHQPWHWPPSLVRALTMAFRENGSDRSWAAAQLHRIERTMLEGVDTAEQVEQWHLQAEAWHELGEPAKSDQCVRGMLKSSLGISSHKDYQLNAWLQWLGRVTEIEPGHAAKRFAWFSEAIRELDKETGGGAAHAASLDLLSVVFRWSPLRAIRLFNWLIEQGLVPQPDGLRELMLVALQGAAPPIELILTIYTRLVMWLSLKSTSEVASRLIETAAARSGRPEIQSVAQQIVWAADRYSFSDDRGAIRDAVARALTAAAVPIETCGLLGSDLREAEEDTVRRGKLRLRDGSELTADQVLSRVSRFADLESLTRQESTDSNFDWCPVIDQVATTLAPGELVTLGQLIRSRRRSTEMLARIADRLHSLGESAAAWEVGTEALGSV